MTLTYQEIALENAQRQQYLFKALPKRAELIKLKSKWICQEVVIRVHRNHSFEYVASVLNPFLAFAGYQAKFVYSDYDDSLFFNIDDKDPASVEIIWLDYDRYFGNNSSDLDFFVDWLDDRINALRKISKIPILINDWPYLNTSNQIAQSYNYRLTELLKDKPMIKVCSQQGILAEIGEKFFDTRTAKLTGTNWSDQACILNARQLAFRWIPQSLSSRLKAIVVDLDMTLYEGVIGEDGIDRVFLSDAHRQFQQELLRLKESGIFLAIASRNEQKDVEELFQNRIDFPLKLEDFAAIQVNWQDKTESITKIAASLRIGIDSILFIDDNLGEIAKVSQSLPSIKTLLASHKIATVDILRLYPHLWGWEKTDADNLRLADLNASSVRDLLITESQDIQEYWKALQVNMDIHFNAKEQLIRLCELSQKTNQFNLNFARINEIEMSDYLCEEDCIVASVHLRDRLSDSGIIGLVIGEKVDKALVIQEICISCRALGRHLESMMISCVLHKMIDLLSTKIVVLKWQKSSRNSPALNWLEQFTKVKLGDDCLEINLDNAKILPIDTTHLSVLKINTYYH